MNTSVRFRSGASRLSLGIAAVLLAGTAEAQVIVFGWNGSSSTVITDTANWNSGSAPTFGGTLVGRIDALNGTNNTMTYTAAQGSTTISPNSARALVIGNSTDGSMLITGGTLTLNSFTPNLIGANSVNGTLTINGGAFLAGAQPLQFGINSTTGTATLTLTSGSANVPSLAFGQTGAAARAVVNLDGGTFVLGTTDTTGVSGAATFNFNGGTLQSSTATANFLGGFTTANVGTGGARINAANDITITQGLLGSAGDGGLTKSGAGTLTLSASNAYTGNTRVNGGTLVLSNAAAAGTGTVVLAGGTLSPTVTGLTTAGLSVAAGDSGVLMPTQASGVSTGTMSVDGGLTLRRSTGGTEGSWTASALVGSGTLVVENTNGGVAPNGTNGRVILPSTSTFTGSVVVQDGGYLITNWTTVNLAAATVNAGGLLAARDGSITLTSLSGAGTIMRNGGTGPISLVVGGGAFSGSIFQTSFAGGGYNPGLGAMSLTKTSANTLVLSGSSQYAGTTTIDQGTLQIGNGGTTGMLPSTAISGSSGATLAFSRTDNYGGNFANTISGGLGVRVNSGALTLAGANLYSGATTIAGGTLALDAGGSFANSSSIIVGNAGSSGAVLDLTAKTGSFDIGAGQTLGGGGTVQLASSGTLNVLGLLSPGNSPGLLTFDAGTTLLSGTTLMEISGLTRATDPSHGTGFYDAINVVDSGVFTFGGLLQLAFDQTFSEGYTFSLFTPSGGGSLAGNFSNVAVVGSVYNTLTWSQSGTKWTSSATPSGESFEFNAATGNLTFAVVPEPGALALAGIGIVAAAWVRRRRRK